MSVAIKTLRRWARRGFIVYVRPHFDGKSVAWIVQVEGGPKVLTGQGDSLAEAVEKIEDEVPRRPVKEIDSEWLKPKKR
jgi:hypothetical protein